MVLLLTPVNPLECYSGKATEHQQVLYIKVLTKWQSKTHKGNRKILFTFPDRMMPTELTHSFLKNKQKKKFATFVH